MKLLPPVQARVDANPSQFKIYKNGAVYDLAGKSFVRADGTTSTQARGRPGRPRKHSAEPKADYNAPPRPDPDKPQAKPADAGPQPAGESFTGLGDKPTPKTGEDSARAPGREYTKDEKITLARQLVGVHKMAALLSGIPELEISEPEGASLSEALAGMAKEYGVPIVSPKTVAMMNLIATCAMVYGPRAVVIAAKSSAQKRAKAQAKAQAQQGTTREPTYTAGTTYDGDTGDVIAH